MSSATLLNTLLRQKAWINTQFFDQIAKLDATEHADVLRTMVRTLNHIHVVDRIFAAHLRGEPHGYEGTNTTETPTQAALRASVAEVDAWYVDYSRAITPEQLAEVLDFRFTDGDAGRMSREEILAHVATHGSYHRGEVGRLLKNTPVPPPRDLLTKFLHDSEPQRRA
jgi:uncharacterized damage-inducible protein DinB